MGCFDGIFDTTPDHSLQHVVPLNHRCESMSKRILDRFTLWIMVSVLFIPQEASGMLPCLDRIPSTCVEVGEGRRDGCYGITCVFK